jgi:voltage-gated potassium channel
MAMAATTTSAALPSDPESDAYQLGKPADGWRRRLFTIIFEADTPAGKLFDVVLIIAILLSVAAVLADSVESIAMRHGAALNALEWTFTLLFTVEYIARISCVERPMRYARSFYGIVDLLAILPTYLAVFLPEAGLLIDIRILRLMRVFRIFKLTAYLSEYRLLADAMANSRRKIMVFLSFVVMIVLIVGTLMYVIEGPEYGFTSIPLAVYWAISTMTTVGYGDLVPGTDIGRMLASVMMLIGWGVLAVPTGIVTAEMTAQHFKGRRVSPRKCRECGAGDHDEDASYCRVCGTRLEGKRTRR